uniref:Short-chain dehydrogenase n=1 Tax=OCS116 cluster bacterium TaxID=2030921 RepID=A0A2A4Z2P9_9PROT
MTIKLVNDRFAGKTAIVTGAGSGIGRATAIRLAKEGARVIATDIVQQRLDEVKAELADCDVECITGDVSQAETINAIMAKANGKVDILANVAGIMDGFLPAAEIDDAIWDRVFLVNVTAVMRLTRAVLPLMVDANYGAIVNVSSEASLRGSAAGAAYTASKHAVNGFTKNTAFMYVNNGIRVNAVAPGAVKTNIEAPMNSEFAAGRVGPVLQNVVPSVAEAEQLAAAICWLASDDSSNVTGVILPSDGGWSAI